MMVEMKCLRCGAEFVAAFTEPPPYPLTHCISCGGKDLKFIRITDEKGPVLLKKEPTKWSFRDWLAELPSEAVGIPPRVKDRERFAEDAKEYAIGPMRTREEIVEDWEHLLVVAEQDRLLLEVLLDIRDLLRWQQVKL